jgi:RNA polymerase sigma-70 factor (ECF subfamily)
VVSAEHSRPDQPPALPPGTVERLREGDADAFSAVYEAYRARLYTFLLRLSRDEQLAKDLSQETWLRLAANARRLEPSTEPAAWLFRVARNLFVSQRRWSRVHDAALAALRLASVASESPLERVAADATQRRIERTLAELPMRYREVLLLVAVEGFGATEVAAMLGISHAAVRQRLSRSRAAIARVLMEAERGGTP